MLQGNHSYQNTVGKARCLRGSGFVNTTCSLRKHMRGHKVVTRNSWACSRGSSEFGGPFRVEGAGPSHAQVAQSLNTGHLGNRETLQLWQHL